MYNSEDCSECNNTPLPCVTPPSDCVTEPCAEIYDTNCVQYNGPNIICNSQVLIPAGARLQSILQLIGAQMCTVNALSILDSTSIHLSGLGTVGSPLIATAIIKPAGDNALQSTSTGLYVPINAAFASALLTVIQADTTGSLVTFNNMVCNAPCNVPSPCGPLLGFTIGTPGTTTTISWSALSGAISYTVEYRPHSGPGAPYPWSVVSGISGTSYDLTGLAVGQIYDVQARAVCTVGVSNWVSGSFTVPGSLPVLKAMLSKQPEGYTWINNGFSLFTPQRNTTFVATSFKINGSSNLLPSTFTLVLSSPVSVFTDMYGNSNYKEFVNWLNNTVFPSVGFTGARYHAQEAYVNKFTSTHSPANSDFYISFPTGDTFELKIESVNPITPFGNMAYYIYTQTGLTDTSTSLPAYWSLDIPGTSTPFTVDNTTGLVINP